MQVTVRWVHKYNPSVKDVEGPFEARENDFADLPSARAWLKKHGYTVGRATFRREGRKFVIFPTSRSASSPHSIIVSMTRHKRLTGGEIDAMARRLHTLRYPNPNQLARRLYRQGVRLAGRWTSEGTAEGHLREGGLAHSGHRWVGGVKEYPPYTSNSRDRTRRRTRRTRRSL